MVRPTAFAASGHKRRDSQRLGHAFAFPITPATYQSKLPDLAPAAPGFCPPLDAARPRNCFDAFGPVKGFDPFSTLSAAASRLAHLLRNRGAQWPIIWPRPSRSSRPVLRSITLLAVAVTNGPQVEPRPAYPAFRRSARASIDPTKLIDAAVRRPERPLLCIHMHGDDVGALVRHQRVGGRGFSSVRCSKSRAAAGVHRLLPVTHRRPSCHCC